MRVHPGIPVLLLAAVGGCQRQAAAQGQPPPPPAVTVVQPVQREVTEYRDFTGRIEAVETLEVRARVAGFLQEIHFQEGTEVKEGDLLYEIDPRTFQNEVARAQADVTRLQAQLTLAGAELDRAAQLQSSRAVTPEEYQQRLAARDAARAALQQGQAALASAELQLSFTRITAPISGRISRTLVTRGNLVGQNEPTLLTTIVRVDPTYVYFDAPERDFLQYQKLLQRDPSLPTAAQNKLPIQVGLETEEGWPHAGIVDFRDNRIDPGTATILLRGELPNPDRVLTPGLFARVRVPFGRPRQRLLVPEVALQADQRGPFVLVVDATAKVAYRPVEPGTAENGLVVIRSGLQAGDRVIVNGLLRARPGATVQAQLAEVNAVLAQPPAGANVTARAGTGAAPPTNAPVPPPANSPGNPTK